MNGSWIGHATCGDWDTDTDNLIVASDTIEVHSDSDLNGFDHINRTARCDGCTFQMSRKPWHFLLFFTTRFARAWSMH